MVDVYKYRMVTKHRCHVKNIRVTVLCATLLVSLVAHAWLHKVRDSQSVALLQRTVNVKSDQIKELKEELRKANEENDMVAKEISELNNDVKNIRTVRARVTAYAPLDNKSGICADGNPTVTATGTSARRGVVAVDPTEIPYFTTVNVPGYGIASAEDTGGAIRNYTEGVAIDVLVDTYEEAMEWGVQYLDVEIQ